VALHLKVGEVSALIELSQMEIKQCINVTNLFTCLPSLILPNGSSVGITGSPKQILIRDENTSRKFNPYILDILSLNRI
jgi:hypothetical protein